MGFVTRSTFCTFSCSYACVEYSLSSFASFAVIETAGSTFVVLAQSLRLRETGSVLCRIALWDSLRDEFWPSFSCNFLIPNKRRDYILKTVPWNPVVQFDTTPSQSLTFSRLYATCSSPMMHLICPPKFWITFVFRHAQFLWCDRCPNPVKRKFRGRLVGVS